MLGGPAAREDPGSISTKDWMHIFSFFNNALANLTTRKRKRAKINGCELEIGHVMPSNNIVIIYRPREGVIIDVDNSGLLG